MTNIIEILTHLNTRKGWHVIRCSKMLAVTVWLAGFAKVQICGNAPDTWQMRITGDGKKFLQDVLVIEE